MSGTCADCRYATPTAYRDGDLGYECRRFPPQLASAEGEDGTLSPWQAWPQVELVDWCGEWALATPANLVIGAS